MKIFITGGTGYLGLELLKELHGRNHRITSLIRSPERASSFPSGVDTVQGAVEDLDSYRAALKGQDSVVHVAALVKMWVRDRRQFDRINVQALENLMRASGDAGVKKFVYTSSFIALGPSNGQPLTEEDSRRTDHFHNDYERTKYLGDQVARKFIQEGYPVYILYPGVIYGPGNLTDGNIVAKNVIPFLNGRMPFGLALKEWSYAYIKDVVQAFVRVIEGEPPSRRYILGGQNHSGSSFYRALQEVTGKKSPAVNIPMSVAYVAGYSEYMLAVLFGREPSLLTHEVVQIYRHSWSYDSNRAIRELNYNITSLHDGLAEMVGWLRKAGYIR